MNQSNKPTHVLQSGHSQQDNGGQGSSVGERIIRAREDERHRLAREIHDGPAQALANIVLRAEVCERLFAAGRPEATQELSQLKLLVKESLREVRKIIYDLRPMTLDELGLVPTLERYFDYMRDHNGTPVKFTVTGPAQQAIHPAVEVALFRTVQEAVNNAWRHAQATQIDVTFQFVDEAVEVTVADNGIGFDVPRILSELKTRRSFGLQGMRERIELLQGEFQVESVVDQGTVIRFRVPHVLADE